MHISNCLTRFMNYYQQRGFFKTLRRLFEEPTRAIFKNQMILVYADLNRLDDSVLALPENIIIESKSTYDEAVQPDMKRMVNYWLRDNEMDKIKKRFEKGATLWIIKLNNDVAGYVWSIRGRMAAAFPLPVTPHDAVVFNSETFEEYRGHGLYALLMNYILGHLKLQGSTRVYGFLHAWNTAVICGIKKTYFHEFSEVRRFYFAGRNITIWS